MGRKAQDPTLAERWEEDEHSSEVKVKTRKGDNVSYNAVSSSVVSLHYGKKSTKAKMSLQDWLASILTSERRREKVTRLSLELGCDYPSVRVTWSWNIQYARYGHLWLRKHNLIAWITTQTFDIGLNQLCSCIGLKLLHKSSGPGCWRSPCSIFQSCSQVSW